LADAEEKIRSTIARNEGQKIFFFSYLSKLLFQLIIVIVNCKQVANVPHSAYGIFARAIHGAKGYTAPIAQSNVPRVKRISIDARKLFLRPNCSGVKRK